MQKHEAQSHVMLAAKPALNDSQLFSTVLKCEPFFTLASTSLEIAGLA